MAVAPSTRRRSSVVVRVFSLAFCDSSSRSRKAACCANLPQSTPTEHGQGSFLPERSPTIAARRGSLDGGGATAPPAAEEPLASPPRCTLPLARASAAYEGIGGSSGAVTAVLSGPSRWSPLAVSPPVRAVAFIASSLVISGWITATAAFQVSCVPCNSARSTSRSRVWAASVGSPPRRALTTAARSSAMALAVSFAPRFARTVVMA
mmetsp:Transcript_34683/g.97796  ORF Transcript_34683/g.97796 Transcript_34683/m.97796 type:complete len:207 (+) Transcript_34683:933-1553(+)